MKNSQNETYTSKQDEEKSNKMNGPEIQLQRCLDFDHIAMPIRTLIFNLEL